MEKKDSEPIGFNLKERIFVALEDQKEIYSTIELIKIHVDQNRKSKEFTPSELQWLWLKIEFLPSIIESQVASGVFYWIDKMAGTNPYDIAKKLGCYYRATDYWFVKLSKYGLIVRSEVYKGQGNKNRYYFNPKMVNVTNMILELINKRFGQAIHSTMSKHKNKQWEYLKEWRKNNPELVKKHKGNKY